MAKHVPHQITFIAMQRHADGTLSVYDIIETSWHYAARLYRRLARNPETAQIMVRSPNSPSLQRINIR